MTVDPRLVTLLRGLADVQRRLELLEVELVEYLREKQVTLEDIGECYEPPKSRQALSNWLKARRGRRGGGP